MRSMVKPTTLSVAPNVSRPKAVSCPAAVPEHSKMNHSVNGRPLRLAEVGDAGFQRLLIVLAGVQREGRRSTPHDLQLLGVDVDGDNGRASCLGDLRRKAAYAPDADDDGEGSGTHARAKHRLIRRCDRIGDHRDVRKAEAGFFEAALIDNAQPARRDHDMRGEAAMDIVSRHLLAAADVRQAALAQIAVPARQHRRNDDGFSKPVFRALARGGDASRDFVPERERQRMVRAHAVEKKAEVGVANAASRNRDHHFASASPRHERLVFQGRPNRGHNPAAGFNSLCHRPSLSFQRRDWLLFFDPPLIVNLLIRPSQAFTGFSGQRFIGYQG